ncbi:putative 6-hydroxy-D-nicotine oxidase [Viridothelium virens]|uniref:Putative 6-hydroxy-D-nicotine oxidase n=1 Tax=Viridothelium virens TaxID=1048519 RepID=A0A6A6HGS1_VIRVR|nr:putative 6-hydroxy-D-nicotine oxidase [Viridothelium virens]
MAPNVRAFVDSLSLPTSTADALKSNLEAISDLAAFLNGNRYDAVSLSCVAARAVLDADSIDTTPDADKVDANWSQACWMSPTCIISPKSAEDVSKILKIIGFFKTKFAIRSGGHSPNPGWSSIDQPGVLIDLRRLNQVTVSEDQKVVSLGPGGIWGDVYAALDAYDFSVIGGRLPNIGVGGLILGGGLFHFSAQFGLAADNVKNFEIVLGDGTITNANAEENSDLWWALKGGSSNFGIVTRFDVYTVPVKHIWYEVQTYPLDQADTVLDAFAQWQMHGAPDVKGTVALIMGLDVLTVGLLYSTPAERPECFSTFYGLPGMTAVIPGMNGTLNALTQILGTVISKAPQRHDYRGVSTKIDAQLYKDVYAFWKGRAIAVNKTTGAKQTFTLQSIPVSLVEQGISKGGNALGLPKIDHQWWTTLIDWDDAKDDTAVRSVSIATTEKFRELSKVRGLEVDFLDLNDASRDQSPLATYGAENVEKLKVVSKKYDPSQVFQSLQNDGFLLSKI